MPFRRLANSLARSSLLVAANLACLVCTPDTSHAQHNRAAIRLPDRWEYSAPLIAPENRTVEPSHAQKDPTLVFHEGRWHVFMTVKLPGRSAIEYCSFQDWAVCREPRRLRL